MRAKRGDWKSTATDAAAAKVGERLRSVTAAWAAARQDYLALHEANCADVGALRLAVQRLQNADRMRRSLADQLRPAA